MFSLTWIQYLNCQTRNQRRFHRLTARRHVTGQNVKVKRHDRTKYIKERFPGNAIRRRQEGDALWKTWCHPRWCRQLQTMSSGSVRARTSAQPDLVRQSKMSTNVSNLVCMALWCVFVQPTVKIIGKRQSVTRSNSFEWRHLGWRNQY